jgi:gliding-associated putative ABC transporter substrate-binding component GldG
MKTQAHILKFAFLFLAIIILVNLVGQRFDFRLDLTEDKRYTLSAATKEMLSELEEPITVSAYFTENLPPDLELVKSDFKDLLIEYAERSGGNLVYEFINPNESEELEKVAQENGVQPFLASVRENDRAEQLRAYMGATFRMGELTDVIPLIQPGSPLEYLVSSSVKKISSPDKPIIGLVQGHGEANLRSMPEVMGGLNVLFEVQSMALFDSVPVNDRFDALMIVNPTDSFSQAHLAQLDAFLAKGKNLLIAMDRVSADLTTSQYGSANTIVLEEWLARKGVNLKPSFVVDKNSGQVQIRQQRGIFSLNTPVAFHYFPLFKEFSDHPVTAGLDAVIMQFTCPLTFTGDSTVRFTPLLTTSELSNELPAPQVFDIQKQWTDADFPVSNIPVAGAFEGPMAAGSPGNRMVVFGNGSFAVNGEGQNQQRLNPDNVNLMVNSVEWLSDKTGLIELRTRGTLYRPIEDLEESERTMLKWFNLLAPIFLVLIYGLIRYNWRKKQRITRMLPDHVE